MRKIIEIIKKEAMLSVSLLVAIISLFITPPSKALLTSIDWKTLATLFMLLSVLDGFKKENLFLPVIRLAGSIKTQMGLTFFLVFSVFISSMFVTNDVSLIIFVPLTIILFRAGGQEQNIIPTCVLENMAAVRGSLLTPFGSPQNLFLFSKSGVSAFSFMAHMSPLWIVSAILLSCFIVFRFRKNLKAPIVVDKEAAGGTWTEEGKIRRVLYLALFILVIITIVTRTTLWPYVTAFVTLALLVFDKKVFKRVDYALLLTFLCFFVFSSSIAANPTISSFMESRVANNEYWWSLVISQVISNVPASIVLWPFTKNLWALLYGLDSAGLITIIGSLASVINIRLYTREYPGKGKDFMKTFEVYGLIFFVIIVIPQMLLYQVI